MARPITPATQRLWSKVDRSPGDWRCHPWTGAVHKFAGGKEARGVIHEYTPEKKSIRLLVHRVAWEALLGPIPGGMTIDHLCGNPLCCNVQHLDLVPAEVNGSRGSMIRNIRRLFRPHCSEGHEMTEENTWYLPVKRMTGDKLMPRCRICKRQKLRDWRAGQE